MSSHRALRSALVDWFCAGHRDMPWRRTRDPYAIWVSEIMLQQTRVETVTPYYERWMAQFPTVGALARAPLDDVLAAWRGLGYYARARNLHAAAKEVEAEYDGKFPRKPDEIIKLKGVGAYTAGAIASIAYGLPEPIVDGNVARVLTRVFRLSGDPRSKDSKAALWKLARELVPADAASEFNQGMMELGALVCTPRAPKCKECPLRRQCGAFADGEQERYPEKTATRAVPRVDHITICMRDDDERVFLGKRPAKGLWGGLWEFPTTLLEGDPSAKNVTAAMKPLLGTTLTSVAPLTQIEQTLTHRHMTFHVFTAKAARKVKLAGYDESRWMSGDDARRLGVAAWTTRLLRSFL